MKKILLTVGVFLLGLTLVACKSDKRTGEKVTIKQTITITTEEKNEKGENKTKTETVEQEMFVNPKRVVSFSYGVADILYQVGIKDAGIEVFGLSKGTGLPDMVKQFASDKDYPNVGTLFEENMEVLELINPELIILDGRSSKLYTKLKTSFPEADVLDVSNTTFKLQKQNEVVEALAKLFPKVKAKLEQKISEINSHFEGILEKAKEFSALFLMSNGTDLSVSGKGGRYGVLHNEFGFKEADPDGKVGEAHGNTITLEYLKVVDPEILFIMDRASVVTGNSGLESLKNEAMFKELSAYKNDKVFILDAEAWYLVTGGFTSTQRMIDDINVFIETIK